MWIAIIVPYGILYSLVYGNVAALQCDLFTAKVRYTGISFVYQMTSVVAGMTALIATALVKMNDGDHGLYAGMLLDQELYPPCVLGVLRSVMQICASIKCASRSCGKGGYYSLAILR